MARRPGSPIGAGKIVLIVLGAVSLLFGLALAAAGGVVLFAQSAFRDAQGYFVSGPHPFTSIGYAVTSERLDLGVNPERGAFQIGGIFTLRLRVANEGAREAFVGIGRSTDVAAYLSRSTHDEVTDVSIRPFRATYRHVEGTSAPGAPTRETFWVEAAHGPGEQTLRWQPRAGSWTLVIMNPDGTRSVNAAMSIGVRVHFLTWIAIGLLIAALLAFIAGALMLYFGVRAPKRLPSETPSDPVLATSSHE